jgi:hypothetical protein
MVGVVKSRPLANLFPQTIKVLIVFVEYVGVPVRERRKAEEIENHA